MTATYPYTPEWKQAQDKSSEPWRAYCEARSLARRFLEKKVASGVDSATTYIESYLESVIEKRGTQSADKLRKEARLVVQGEGREILSSLSL